MEEPHHTEETNDDAGTFVVTGSGALVVAAAATVGGGGANTANAVAAVHIFNNNEVVAVAVAETNEDDTDANNNADGDGDDDDDNNEDDNDTDATVAEEEDEDEDRNAIQKLLAVVQQREDFPVRQRNKIIELAHQFVNNLGTDIQEMVTDQRTVADGYAGLDCNRDTPKEVETALRHYPETLSERGGRYDEYPIKCIATIYDRHKWRYNPMAVSFVVLFAKLAIEFNSFADEERGGLLTENGIGENTLIRLVQSSHKLCDEDYHQRVDTEFLEVLVQLRRSGLFKKEDIQQYELVHRVCKQTTGYFAESRFQFLTNWDPSSLVQLNNYGELPLHYSFAAQTLRQFQVMLDTYFRYFTKEKVICLLFQQATSNGNITPFRSACTYLHKHKTDTLVHDVVEQSLGTARFSSPTTIPSASLASSLNLGTVLMMAARNDNNISLDGWYYCIRRQPDTMLSMLHTQHCRYDGTVSAISLSSSSSFNNNTGTNGRNNTTNNDDDENDDDDDDAAASQNNNTNVF